MVRKKKQHEPKTLLIIAIVAILGGGAFFFAKPIKAAVTLFTKKPAVTSVTKKYVPRSAPSTLKAAPAPNDSILKMAEPVKDPFDRIFDLAERAVGLIASSVGVMAAVSALKEKKRRKRAASG